MPATLNEYYSSKGQALPSLAERGGVFETMGLGAANGYQGTSQQNIALLGALQRGGTPAPATSATPSPAPQGELDIFNSKYATGQQDILNRQKAETDAAMGPSLQETDATLRKQYDVEGLNKTVQAYKDESLKTKALLDRLGEDINSRTRGTLTSQSQVNRMNAAEGESLRNQLGRLSTGAQPAVDALNGANSAIANQLGLYSQDRQTKLGVVQDRFAREMTGYTQQKENELNTILMKIERQQQLSDREWQQAADLAKMERAHRYALDEAKSQGSGGLNIAQALKDWSTGNQTNSSTGGKVEDFDTAWDRINGNPLKVVSKPSGSGIQKTAPVAQGQPIDLRTLTGNFAQSKPTGPTVKVVQPTSGTVTVRR